MTKAELAALIHGDTNIGDHLLISEVLECCDEAMGDTGWSFPISGTFQEHWSKQRTKRHCFFRLWTEAARKFKVEQINLGDRFTHYGKVIELMDLRFEKIMEDYPEEFSGVDAYKMFGTVVRPGIKYDIAGNDITDYTDRSDCSD